MTRTPTAALTVSVVIPVKDDDRELRPPPLRRRNLLGQHPGRAQERGGVAGEGVEDLAGDGSFEGSKDVIAGPSSC